MHLRIGISAGEPVAEDGDLFGSTVQLAARLCAHANTDDILIADAVYRSCPLKAYPIDDAGRISPKGFDGEMPVYRVNWRA